MSVFNFFSSFVRGLKIAGPFPFGELSSNALYRKANEKHERNDGKCCRGLEIVFTGSKITGYGLRYGSKKKEAKSRKTNLCLAAGRRKMKERKKKTGKQYNTERKKKRCRIVQPCDQNIHILSHLLPYLSGTAMGRESSQFQQICEPSDITSPQQTQISGYISHLTVALLHT